MAYIHIGGPSNALQQVMGQTDYYRQMTGAARQNEAALQRQTVGAFSGGFGQGMQLGSDAVQRALNRKFTRERDQQQQQFMLERMDREEEMIWNRIGMAAGFRTGDAMVARAKELNFETVGDYLNSEDARQRLKLNGLLFAQQMQQEQARQAQQQQAALDQRRREAAPPALRKQMDALDNYAVELETSGRFSENEKPRLRANLEQRRNILRREIDKSLKQQDLTTPEGLVAAGRAAWGNPQHTLLLTFDQHGRVSPRPIDLTTSVETGISEALIKARTPQERAAVLASTIAEYGDYGPQQWDGKKWIPLERPKQEEDAGRTVFGSQAEARRGMPFDDYAKLVKEARENAKATAGEDGVITQEAIDSALRALVQDRIAPPTFAVPGSGIGVQAPANAQEAYDILYKLKQGELDPERPEVRWLVQKAKELLNR